MKIITHITENGYVCHKYMVATPLLYYSSMLTQPNIKIAIFGPKNIWYE